MDTILNKINSKKKKEKYWTGRERVEREMR
jgi:hypothetical protein